MAIKITIEIQCGNDVMQTSEDVVALLVKAGERLHHNRLVELIKRGDDAMVSPLADENGNTVGSLMVSYED